MTSTTITLIVAVILLVIILWFLIEEIWDLALFVRKTPRSEVKNLSTLRALSLFEHLPDFLAVDVRPNDSFRKRHLPSARNAPFVDDKLETENIADLDRDRPILIYCDGGYRSRKAVGAFIDAGFTRIYHLNRGFMMWRTFGGPTEPKE